MTTQEAAGGGKKGIIEKAKEALGLGFQARAYKIGTEVDRILRGQPITNVNSKEFKDAESAWQKISWLQMDMSHEIVSGPLRKREELKELDRRLTALQKSLDEKMYDAKKASITSRAT